MLRGRLLHVGFLALVVLLVSFGRTEAQIGFRYKPLWEKLVDPIRHGSQAGFTNEAWDSTSIDTTTLDSALAIPALKDSLLTDTLKIEKPDSSYSSATVAPSSSSVGTGTGTEPLPSDGTSPYSGQEIKEVKSPGISLPVTDPTQSPGTVGGKQSLEPGLMDIAPIDEEEEEEEEPPEWHPTIIRSTALPLDYSTEIDTATGFIIMSPRLDGVALPITGAMTQELYLQRSVERSDRETWQRSVLNKLPKSQDDEGGAIEISIPVFKGKWADRVFGGRDVGLSVSGEITINGGLRTEKREDTGPSNTNPNDVKFEIDQTQRFNIKGKVGEKVSVEIDQDSERLFEFENNLRVTYKGNPDEIIQKIEAGNVNLSLPGAKFVSGSGRHQGLFGIKVESQIGALKLITVASLDKSEKQTKKIEGGSESSGPKRIDPNDFVKNRYFFLDSDYRDAYKHRNPLNMEHYTITERQIVAYEVYKSVKASTQNLNAVPGWALYDPSEEPDEDTEPDRERQRGLFSRLTPGLDYELNTELGYIRLSQFIDNKDILAVAFKTRNQLEYGDLEVPDDPESETFVLKLIKPQDPVSTDPTWDLMWRHVYDLGSTGIEWEGFEGKIDKATSDEDNYSNERLETYLIDGEDKRFIEIFSLDLYGQTSDPNPDDMIDRVFVNTSLGELEFPDLKPFDPEGWYFGQDRNEASRQINPLALQSDSSLFFTPQLYTADDATLNKTTSDFRIEVKYQNVSATYDLGFMVLEGSEEVTLNGHRLNKGIDYNIDYVGGNLTILNREATAPDAKLEIKYETGQMMQLDTKTVLGLRAQYELWEDSYIGSTVMYRSEKSMDQRIRLGGEPLQNSIWDINASLNFKPNFLTRAVDWLPLIETNEPSSFTIEGEIAQVYPNPNSFNSPSTGDNNGVAYVDDFESVKRSVPLGIIQKLWTAASFPDHHYEVAIPWLKQRGRMIWYNDINQEKIKDIWPEREVQAQASKTNVLRIEYQPWWTEWEADKPEDLAEPERSWGGIMKYLGAGFANQSESKYIELWINRLSTDQGYLYIDIGQISEDVIPNRILDTEDRPTEAFPFGSTTLETSEDTGLDLISLEDPLDTMVVNEKDVYLPSYDDWHYDSRNRDDYTHVNGQDGNMNATDGGGRYPDTEDLDGDTYLDQTNSYFRYKIDLSEKDDNKYIAGGQENEKGWRLYRIPLSDTLVVGRPSMTSIEYARLWMAGMRKKSSIKIAQIEIVGNEWLELEDKNRAEGVEPVSIAVINTHDNPEYSDRQPPGVAGELDPVTGLRAKEQSLVMRVNRLGPGETGMIYKHMQKSISLLDYKLLKMFVHGGGYSEQLVDRFNRPLDLEMFIRIGYDTDKKFYEYSQRLNPGWHKENEIVIDLERLSSIKFLREQDSTRNYDILPNGDVIRVVGSPSLSDIKDIVIGVKNHGREISRADGVEIWFDELRVSDVNRDPGWAARGSMKLEIADLMTISADLSQEDANFHSVDKRGSSNKKDKVLSGDVQVKFSFDKFFDPLWGLKIPITANFSNDIFVPKYKPSSDIKMSSLGGEQTNIFSIFSETLFENDRMSDSPVYTSPTDSLIGIKKSYSINTSFNKSKRSDNPFIKHTLDKVSFSVNHKEDFSSSSRDLFKNGRQNQGKMGYEFSFDEPLEFYWLKWAESIPWLNKYVESTFRPIPRSLTVNFDGTETYTVSKSRTGRENINDRVAIDRGISTSWSPLDMISFTFREQINADRVEEDSMRTFIALNQVVIDRAEYEISDSAGFVIGFDSTAYDSAVVVETARIKDELFWDLFGLSLVDNSLQQSFSTSFKPDLLSWLSADANYNANYNWRWGERYGGGDRTMRLGTSLTATASLGLIQLVNAWNQKVENENGGGSGPISPDPFGEKDPFGGDDRYKDNDPFKQEKDPFKQEEDPFKPGNMKGDEDPFKSNTLNNESISSTGPLPGTTIVPMPDMSQPESPDSLGNLPETKIDSTQAPERRDLTKPIRLLLGRLQDIRYQYTQSNDINNTAVGIGQAKWGYRFGFERDPGVKRIEEFYPRDSHNRREEHSLSSGLQITPNLRMNNLTYDFSQSRNIGSDGSESGTDSRTVWQFFGDDGVSIEELPILNWSASWSGLGEFEIVQKVATSVSFENSFRGNMTETWRGYSHPDSQRTPTRIDYEKAFSPLAGVSVSWIGGVSSNIRYNHTQRVTDERTGRGTKDKTTSESINLSASYNARKGFSVPLPVWPFKNRRFKNSTNFSLNYTYSHEVRETSGDGDKFEETDKTTSWSVSPSMEYTFSNTVRGGFQYEYGVRKSKRVPDVKSQEFSFRVNISIRG